MCIISFFWCVVLIKPSPGLYLLTQAFAKLHPLCRQGEIYFSKRMEVEHGTLFRVDT